MTNNFPKYLIAYYFHGQDFCMVRRHVQEDMQWMKAQQTDAIAIGIHEADLLGGNTHMICEEAQRVGLDILAIPSRLLGLVAGWHRAPGATIVEHPQWWARRQDGLPIKGFGPQASIHHPEVFDAVCEYLQSLWEKFPDVQGIIWDEIKCLHTEDHSQAAISALGQASQGLDQIKATCNFIERVNAYIRSIKPDMLIDLFIPAHYPERDILNCSAIHDLDAFGCDGRCWMQPTEEKTTGHPDKLLIKHLPRFTSMSTCQKRFVLLETQHLNQTLMDLTMQHLPQLLEFPINHLAYYYHPCGMADPETYMPRLGEQLAQWRRS